MAKMAENRSKSQGAATLLRRAASILTQNSAESKVKDVVQGTAIWAIQCVQLNSTCPKSTSHNL
jgi:hypothetical protein